MRNVLRSARHVLAMNVFANTSTLSFLQTYRSENIHVVDNKYQPRIGETVEFIYDSNSGDEAMRIGYDLLRQAIINIATPVHVEALAQMLYRIRDCPRRIVFLFYQKNSNELFHPPGRENIWAELASARPNNLPTAIKGHRE
ncbi:hypothetical protein GLOIN_2v1485886 [Rhizophagus irregularis DAOM 181602=DAOM 197198]|uniref:Uncharacterized protein n=1 Tax=Rhizophagus irregularis (strain DAOM 181602 / DAOM 197198 / MUCL 43194) TaxID=747089 RepID=A0A2P4P916_RHIID|nr:hypothetical protein GLOIN_2v1485886 [Rhizophagus irregularis DAOM 181602=DAOM 197198]POG61886.1 hypothetical protein GLOIN_2v1485886 [Rhizophagus irregularis DAOM 181602=DAOM 197198]|eukprot:XP_025168752.1 hypothetical protein GLOIN_2v1485886 [Rhizophagus irregularis DAOM 181602=DAOM 197198]